ncbi:hypothetical protein BegalDRAFT_3499 [Beggiatoa alba B18LD]|uniref:DUF58 domain-containing protein n=1 Tax=Beggiatoa alba B18LD TaxID=395493 RepID=I3CL16_9GAMM|nr:DUF58 domain-containing protein [Beggiatoa alba]EIJ44309.1 hypothetical protein BegalDRAFT_3499 [Beggiatoa alba B18LD]
MLMPTFDELAQLRYQAHSVGLVSAQKTHTPLSGLYASVFRGQGMDFDEVREYRYGDEIRHIDWRVTARARKPYLKTYREERERHVLFCVDMSTMMQFGTRGTFKHVQAARVAALLGWSAQGHGDSVGGLIVSDAEPRFYRPNHAQRAFWHFLKGLSEPCPAPAALPSESPLQQALTVLQRQQQTGALLFIIADLHLLNSQKLAQALRALRQRHELVLINIDDIADYQLPAIGRVYFTAPDGQEVLIDTDNPAGCSAYQQSWEQQRAELQALSRQLQIDFFSLRTDEAVYQGVFNGLRQRAQRQQAHL